MRQSESMGEGRASCWNNMHSPFPEVLARAVPLPMLCASDTGNRNLNTYTHRYPNTGHSKHGGWGGERTLVKEIHTPNCKKRKIKPQEAYKEAQKTWVTLILPSGWRRAWLGGRPKGPEGSGEAGAPVGN